MPKIRRAPTIPVSRKAQERLIQNFKGLNTTYPYTQLKDSESPYFYNCRLYARNSTDRRVAVGTRKGPGFYSVPLGEAVDIQQTSVAGASTQTLTTTTWAAGKFTNTNAGRLTKVDINVETGTAPTQHMIVAIYSDSSGPGTLLATSSILSSSTTSSLAYISARFIEAPALSASTSYWIVAYMQAGGSGNYLWSTTTNASTAMTSTNSGGSWSATAFAMNLKTYVSTNSKYLGGIRYTPSSATAKTVIAHGTNVYTVSDVNGVTTSIKSGLSASATDYYYAQSNDQLFSVNGFDVPQYWDGTTWAVVGGTPGVSKYLTFHKNRLFFVNATDPTKLVFSELSDYQTYLSTNFIYAPAPKSGDPITGVTVFQDNLVVFTRNTKYVLYGDDPGNFILRQSSGRKGATAQATIKSDPNYVYFLSDDGVYRYNGSADEMISDPIQTEISNISDKTKAAGVVHNNYYKLYYPATGATANNSCILWDTLNNFWLRDSETYIDKPFLKEDSTLIEGSSLVGAVYNAEQAYSDLGKPIPFKYWTKYFGDGLRKIFLRRVVPSVRLQTQPYMLNVYIDIDQRNTIPLQYTINALASGDTWGGGETFGSATAIYGSAVVSTPTTLRGSEGLWHQIRFEQSGVDTPVEILSYVLQMRVRRIE